VKNNTEQRLEVYTPFGKLVAEKAGGPDYPGIFIYLEDGIGDAHSETERDLVLVESTPCRETNTNVLKIALWEDRSQEDPTLSRTVDTKEMTDTNEESTEMEYFEIIFTPQLSICCRGLYVPTVAKANEFFADDVAELKLPIKRIRKVSESEARNEFDFDNVDNWPIFGK
jgi:hypothetical protein